MLYMSVTLGIDCVDVQEMGVSRDVFGWETRRDGTRSSLF